MPIPQRTAAIPGYLPPRTDAQCWADVPPGHRFQMYFAYWEADRFTAYKDARLPDIKHLDKKERDRIRKQFDADKKAPLGEVCPLGPTAQAVLKGIRQRQQALMAAHGDAGLRLAATSTAPFATGLGNEHPIENGFAFLTPYGLPYLAGSGVKGVLRRAAEDLALFSDEYRSAHAGGEGEEPPATAMTLLDIWWLFGFESAQSRQGPATAIFDRASAAGRAFERSLPALAARDDLYDFIRMALADDRKTLAYYLDQREDRRLAFLNRLLADTSFRQSIHTRGALDFWDVFPAPAGNRLVVEIMTPHQAGYYMHGRPPNDAESPIPVPFLAVPAGSAFDFHVVCALGRLPSALRETWQTSMRAAFEHAFDWLGFGAKTAVGYGAMKAPPSAPAKRTSTAPQAPANPTPQVDPLDEIWPAAKLTLNPGTGEIKAYFGGKTTAGLKGEAAQTLLAALGERAAKLKKAKELKNIPVRVRQESNLIVLTGIEPVSA
jgi:CRISPR-associated protein Cmr6